MSMSFFPLSLSLSLSLSLTHTHTHTHKIWITHVRTLFGSQAQTIKGVRPKKPNTINL